MSILIIGKGSVEEKVKDERRKRQQDRHQEDVLKGLTRAKGPQRGDFSQCEKLDRVLSDYRRFKNPKDRVKINEEYYGRQKELRKI